MRLLFMFSALLLSAFAAPANAAVVYRFATDEPFVGLNLSFTYQADAFVGATSFVQAGSLTFATPQIARVQFDPTCALGGGNCDQLAVFVERSFGTTAVYRYFPKGAFGALGSYTAAFGSSATLNVEPATVSGVPEPTTWALMILGFGGIGAMLRRGRSRRVLAAA